MMNNRNISFIVLAALYFGICAGAGELLQKGSQDHFLIPFNAFVPGCNLTVKIPLQDSEPLTGKTYDALHREAINEGLPLSLMVAVRGKALAIEVLDLYSFIDKHGSVKKDFTDTSASMREFCSSMIGYGAQTERDLLCHKVSQEDEMRAIAEPDKYLVRGFCLLIGSDYQRMWQVSVDELTFHAHGITTARLKNQGTLSLLLRSLFDKDDIALRALVFLYARHSHEKETLEVYPAITTHAKTLMDGYLKKHPEDTDAKSWL